MAREVPNLEELTHAAYVQAFQTTLGVLAGIMLLAIMVASFIRRVETEDKGSRKRMAVV